MVNATDYAAVNPLFYTVNSLAEFINTIVLVTEWTLTALVWALTITNVDAILWFFVVWAGILHYIEALRFVIVGIMKFVSYFTDNATDYTSISGFEKTYPVSEQYYLTYWNFGIEWAGFMTSFMSYMALRSTIHIETSDEVVEEEAWVEVDEEEFEDF